MANHRETTERATRPRQGRVWATLKALTRTRVMAGLIVVLPLYVTILLLRFVFGLMRDSSQWVVYAVLHGDWVGLLPDAWGITWKGFSAEELKGPHIQWPIAIFSVFLTVFLLYAIGLLTANVVGHRFLQLLERLVDRVPLVKTVYGASKQILSTFATEQRTTFQRVVLVPFPSSDVRSVGFITGTSRDTVSGEELCTVFIATTPNPTTGFVLVLRRCHLTELDWSVEEAIKVVMSGGILMPTSMPFPPGARPFMVPPATAPANP